jgi:hypothetical protein
MNQELSYNLSSISEYAKQVKQPYVNDWVMR